MNRIKHTPGPWEVRVEEQHYVTSAEGRIANVLFPRYSADGAEVMANDRLIAAAPELLEACQTALAFVAGWAGVYQHDHGLPDFHPRHKEAIEQVKYAIAKATGGDA